MEPNNFEKQTTDIVVRAQGLQVVDQISLSKANELSLAGKELIKVIKEFFRPLKENAHASWKGICNAESKELAKIEPIVQRIDTECVRWRVEQDRIRREAEEKRQRAEQERLRVEQEAMRKAQEIEKKALEEQRQLMEGAARKIQEEEAKATRARSEAARKRHEEEMAKIRHDLELQRQEARLRAGEEQDKILAKAAAKETKIIEAAPVVPEKVITQGQAPRDHWTASVFDRKALLVAVIAGKVSDEAVIPNMSFLDQKARESKKVGVEIPGVLFENKPINWKTRGSTARMASMMAFLLSMSSLALFIQ